MKNAFKIVMQVYSTRELLNLTYGLIVFIIKTRDNNATYHEVILVSNMLKVANTRYLFFFKSDIFMIYIFIYLFIRKIMCFPSLKKVTEPLYLIKKKILGVNLP